jgi:hypothetical protein
MRRTDLFLHVAIALILGVLALSLQGCGSSRAPVTKAEERRATNVAEAVAGVDAVRGNLGALMPPDIAAILDGSAAFTRATAEDLQVPAPTWTPARILASPADYRHAGEAAERQANGTRWWFLAKVVGGTLFSVFGTFALACLSKELPVIGPMVGPLLSRFVEGLWQGGTPSEQRQIDDARTTLAAHTSTVLEVAAAALPPGEAAKAVAHLPPEVVDAARLIGIPLPSAGSLARTG